MSLRGEKKQWGRRVRDLKLVVRDRVGGLALNYETVSMGTPLPNIRRRELAGKKSGKLFCVFSVFTNAKYKETTGMLRSVTLA